MASAAGSKLNIQFLFTKEKYWKTKEFSTFSTEFCTMHTLHSDGFMQNKGYIKPKTRRNMHLLPEIRAKRKKLSETATGIRFRQLYSQLHLARFAQKLHAQTQIQALLGCIRRALEHTVDFIQAFEETAAVDIEGLGRS